MVTSQDLPAGDGRGVPRWGVSILLYGAFAAAIFMIQGPRPLLGSDHLSYFTLADSVLQCQAGDYWREASSTKTFGVLLAYLHGWTSSHVVSMKLVLAAWTVAYLVTAELLFALFTESVWRARLFALLSAFAVSFGISSWGVTDSTALLPRTLVAPIIVLAVWWWLRFDGRPAKYYAIPILVLGSLLHLSTFYAIAVLLLVELFGIAGLLRSPARMGGLVAALVASAVVLYGLEVAGFASRVIGVQIPEILRSVGFKDMPNLEPDQAVEGCVKRPAPAPAAPPKAVPAPAPAPDTPAPAASTQAAAATAAAKAETHTQVTPKPPANAKEAWAMELSLRPWRNMPLPLVNVANIFSSSILILLLALAGVVAAWRAGFTRHDRVMLAMFVAVPLFSFGPQTLLWIVRTHRDDVYPATIEEVRALGLVMIPALYFVLRLFNAVVARGGPRMRLKAGAVVVGVLVLPLVMKGLPIWVREGLLSTMTAAGVVDAADASRMANARAALGLGAAASPFYYSTQGVRGWLAANAQPGARILTDRDDMILLRDRTIVGPRQVGATTYYVTSQITDVFLETQRAMAARDLARVKALAASQHADFVVVPWRVAGAAYSDEDFSVLAMHGGGK